MRRVHPALVLLGLVACGTAADDQTVDDDLRTRPVRIAAAGDIACAPGPLPTAKRCNQGATSDLLDPFAKVLVLGDSQYVRGELANFEGSFAGTWGRFKDKLLPAVGNHEYQSRGAVGYFDYFGEAAGARDKGYYSVDVGAWHLVALNTNDECERIACNEGSEQLAWLKADLAKSKKRCSLAFFHHPRWSSGEHGDNDAVSDLYRALYDGGVDVVLAGHDHDYERFAPLDPDGNLDEARGIRSFVVGTGGIGFRRFPTTRQHSEAKQAEVFGVLSLTLEARGYAWAFVPVEGSTYDDAGRGACH